MPTLKVTARVGLTRTNLAEHSVHKARDVSFVETTCHVKIVLFVLLRVVGRSVLSAGGGGRLAYFRLCLAEAYREGHGLSRLPAVNTFSNRSLAIPEHDILKLLLPFGILYQSMTLCLVSPFFLLRWSPTPSTTASRKKRHTYVLQCGGPIHEKPSTKIPQRRHLDDIRHEHG